MEKEIKDHKMVPFYQIGIYAITINPSDKVQYRTKPELIRIKNIREYITSILKDKIRYKLYFDLSTPVECKADKYPRIHFHGIIYLEDNLAVKCFLLEVLPRLSVLSYVKLGPITDINIWQRYCRKYQTVLGYTPIVNKLSFSFIRKNKCMIDIIKEIKEKNNIETIEGE